MSQNGAVFMFCLLVAGPLLVVGGICAEVHGQAPDCNADFYPGRVLVRFKAGTAAPAKQAAHTAAGASEVLKEFHRVDGLQLVKVAAGQEQAAVTSYTNNVDVQYAEPDYLTHLDSIPDDADFGKQWGMRNVGQTLTVANDAFPCVGSAHGNACECPDSGTACDSTGKCADINVTKAWDVWQGDVNFLIAVIDSGVAYGHCDLQGNMWVNEFEDLNDNGQLDGINRCNEVPPVPNGDFNCQDDDPSGGNGCIDDVHGCNFTVPPGRQPNGDIQDSSGHGTQLAGIIAAVGNNGTTGRVSGVNWRAKIVALKIDFGDTLCGCVCAVDTSISCFSSADCASGSCNNPNGGPCTATAISDDIAAIEYCVNTLADSNPNNDIRVSNASWGMPFYCQSLYDVIASGREFGHIVVASAGNEGENINPGGSTPHYPATFGLDNIIAVAGTDNNDNKRPASNEGNIAVDLGAPGQNVFSTYYQTGTEKSTYIYDNGTSMAAAHVTGVVALLWSRVPSLTYLQVRNQILSTTRPVPALQGNTVTGGVVNAYHAILWDCGGICSNPLCVGVGEDCNANGIYDGCEVARGSACDADEDRVLDECAACCVGGACQNLTPSACTGQLVPGLTCNDCSCALSDCCQGEACTGDVAGCVCESLGGFPAPFVGECNNGLCDSGVCCTGGSCANSASDLCDAPGVYHGGTTCTASPDICTPTAYRELSPGPCEGNRGRFISFSPGKLQPDGESSVRITLTSMHHVNPRYSSGVSTPFSACEGKQRWAGPPKVFLESQSTGIRFVASQTQSTHVYRDWSSFLSCTDNVPPFEYGENFSPTTFLPVCTGDTDCPAGETCSVAVEPLLHVTGSAIVPSSSYTVRLLDASCMGNEPSCTALSGALVVSTARWGDVRAPFQLPCGLSHPNPLCQDAATCTAANCTTQADVSDFAAIISKFRSQLGAPIKARSLLSSGGTEGVIDMIPDVGFNHVSAAVAAFQGKAYPYTPECLSNP